MTQRSKKENSLVPADRSRWALRERFQQFLGYLGERQAEIDLTLEEELSLNYQEWSRSFELLKSQFSDLWDLFGSIEQEISDWHRGSPNDARWGSMGLSRDGYHFGASIEKNHRANAAFGSKWLWVTFAWSNGHGGMGDERMLGRSTDIDQSLCGLSLCTSKSLQQKLDASRVMVERLRAANLTFGLHDINVGQKRAHIPLDTLYKTPLRDIAEKLFVALNRDMLKDFSTVLPDGSPLELLDVSPREAHAG